MKIDFKPIDFQQTRPDRAAIQADQEKYQKEANQSTGRRFLSALPGATANTLLRAPARFVASAAVAPVDIARQARGGEPMSKKLPFVGQTFQAEAAQKQKEIVEGERPLYHALQPFAEVPLAAAEAVGAGKIFKSGATKAKNTALGAIDKLADRKERKAIELALEITKPKLSAKEQVKAFERGRGYFSGVKKTVGASATDKDIDVAEAAAGLVKKGNPFKNIGRLGKEVNESTTKVRSGLGQSNAIWNSNELKGWVSGIKKPITVKSDTTLNNQADNLQRALLDLAAKQNKKTVGILDLRQEFDDVIAKEYPNLYDRDLTPIRQYIQEIRRAVNDFAEAKIPDGALPDGSRIKDELRKQHLLLRAIENIAEKAPKIGTTGLQRFGERHPILRSAGKNAGWAVGGAALGGMGLNALR